MNTGLLNTYEAAKILGIAASTLKKYRYEGGGPCYVKIKGRVGYSRDMLQEYINARIYENTSQYLQ